MPLFIPIADSLTSPKTFLLPTAFLSKLRVARPVQQAPLGNVLQVACGLVFLALCLFPFFLFGTNAKILLAAEARERDMLIVLLRDDCSALVRAVRTPPTLRVLRAGVETAGGWVLPWTSVAAVGRRRDKQVGVFCKCCGDCDEIVYSTVHSR